MVEEEEGKVATPSTSLFVPPIATQSPEEEMEEEVSSPSTSMFVPAIETLTPKPQTQQKATTSDQSLGAAIAKASAIKGTYDKSQTTSKASSTKAGSSASLARDLQAPGTTQKRGLLTPGFRTPSASRVKTNSGSRCGHQHSFLFSLQTKEFSISRHIDVPCAIDGPTHSYNYYIVKKVLEQNWF